MGFLLNSIFSNFLLLSEVNSPVLNALLIWWLIVDFAFWNSNAICSWDSHTVSSWGLTFTSSSKPSSTNLTNSKFSDDIKQNYVYHEWDTFYGEYYYLYEIIPRVEKMMNADELSLDQVRLLCRICWEYRWQDPRLCYPRIWMLRITRWIWNLHEKR